jgi:E3 ubiquitin-protein ligase HERC1
LFLFSVSFFCYFRHHDRSISDVFRQNVSFEPPNLLSSSAVAGASKMTEQLCTGTGALIEVAVKTGLNLIFGLLRQNVSMSRQLGTKSNSGVCDEVLRTALDVMMSFAPLSLADKRCLPPLAISALSDISTFLRSMIMPQSGADTSTRRLATELLLVLAAQRGSLHYLLEWIEMALGASSSPEAIEDENPRPRTITHAVFISTLLQIKHAAVS